MTVLIDDLLQLSRAGTVALQRVPVDLSMIARHIAEELQRSQPERKVEFMIANTLPVEADEGLMRIALDNLLRNAWKYTSHRQKACIEVGFRRIRGELVYFVRDDGAGFDPALRDQLFQPFRRLHNRAEFPGTGIGLATVQRILARHGGRIWAEGEIDKGATFYFTLPAAHAAS
jgi:signal transduction histidine kinase